MGISSITIRTKGFQPLKPGLNPGIPTIFNKERVLAQMKNIHAEKWLAKYQDCFHIGAHQIPKDSFEKSQLVWDKVNESLPDLSLDKKGECKAVFADLVDDYGSNLLFSFVKMDDKLTTQLKSIIEKLYDLANEYSELSQKAYDFHEEWEALRDEEEDTARRELEKKALTAKVQPNTAFKEVEKHKKEIKKQILLKMLKELEQ